MVPISGVCGVFGLGLAPDSRTLANTSHWALPGAPCKLHCSKGAGSHPGFCSSTRGGFLLLVTQLLLPRVVVVSLLPHSGRFSAFQIVLFTLPGRVTEELFFKYVRFHPSSAPAVRKSSNTAHKYRGSKPNLRAFTCCFLGCLLNHSLSPQLRQPPPMQAGFCCSDCSPSLPEPPKTSNISKAAKILSPPPFPVPFSLSRWSPLGPWFFLRVVPAFVLPSSVLGSRAGASAASPIRLPSLRCGATCGHESCC